MEEETEEEIISEGAEYSQKSEFSKPKIVYEAVQKCIQSRAQEMKPGYENVKLTREGMPIKTWIEDSRLIFIGSVIALRGLLTPEIKSTKGFSEKIKAIEDKTKEAKEKYSYEEHIQERVGDRVLWKKTERKYIPEIGSSVVLTNPLTGLTKLYQAGWDNKINVYWDIVLTQYDLMFEILNELINKLNYFKAKTNY